MGQCSSVRGLRAHVVPALATHCVCSFISPSFTPAHPCHWPTARVPSSHRRPRPHTLATARVPSSNSSQLVQFMWRARTGTRYVHGVLARHARMHPRRSTNEPAGTWLASSIRDRTNETLLASSSSHHVNRTFEGGTPRPAAKGFVAIESVDDIGKLTSQPPFGTRKCLGWDCTTQRTQCTGEAPAGRSDGR